MKKKIVFMAAMMFFVAGIADASMIFSGTIAGTGGNVTEQVFASYGGGVLTLTLKNATLGTTGFSADLFSGFFWDMPAGVTLTPQTASAATLINDDNSVIGTNVADGNLWAFKTGALFMGRAFGVGSAGFGVFGPPDMIGPCVGACPGGANGGITAQGGAGTTDGIPRHGPYVLGEETITFLVSGTNLNSFTVDQMINGIGVSGTLPEGSTTNASPVSESGTFLLLGSAIAALSVTAHRRAAVG